MGGMPMVNTMSGTSICGSLTNPNLGWWHNGNDAHGIWSRHFQIVKYFTDSLTVFPNLCDNRELSSLLLQANPNAGLGTLIPTSIRVSGDGLGDSFNEDEGRPVFDEDADVYETTFAQSDLSLFVNLTDGVVRANQIDNFYNLINTTLGTSIQQGDYVFIAPEGEDGHGFVVVGWGAIMDCSLVGNSVSLVPVNSAANLVPYVADFNNRLQSQKPRPFYCSWHNEVGFSPGSFSEHNWWFYMLPNAVEITPDQIYTNVFWNWEASE